MSQDATPTDIDSHPCPPNWAWYASFDGGEHYSIGPCETRQSAIDEAIDDDLGAEDREDGLTYHTFIVAEAMVIHNDLSKWFHSSNLDLWLDTTFEDMDEEGMGGDEDGNHHPAEEITNNLREDLKSSIQASIRDWQKRHNLPLKSYWFGKTRNIEQLTVREHDREPIEGSYL